MDTTDSRRRTAAASSVSGPAVRYLPAVARSSVTCRHSSRVGTTTRARGAPVSGLVPSPEVMRCSSGTPKANVLPMPVRAWPITSSPSSASGRVSSWIAKGRLMPSSLMRGLFRRGLQVWQMLIQLCVSLRSYEGKRPSVTVSVVCRCFSVAVHARMSSDSDYVAESPAPSTVQAGQTPCTHISPVAAVEPMPPPNEHDSWSASRFPFAAEPAY